MTISEDKNKEAQTSSEPNLPAEVEAESSPNENTFVVENPIQERKRNIMDHLNKSSNNFSNFVNSPSKERNSKIREHIKKSLS